MKIKNFIGRFTHACSRLKIGTRILALLLSVILIFYVIPSVVYAEILNAFENMGSGSDSLSDAAQTEQTNIYDYKGAAYELTDSREESTKHFHLEDGSYVAAHYNYPVHYVDENGEYRDIDNSLTEDSNGEFSNSNARIKFAKKITGNGSLFTLHDGNTKITFSLIGANKGTVGTVTNGEDAESDTELQKLMNLEKLSSSVIYRDILPGVDLEYIIESLNIKENVIIKKKSDSYSYTFELKLNGLVAALSENGDIEITDENTKKVKYVIPAPVLYDANGVYAPSEAAFYTLTANGKKYTLTLNASSEWMNAPERVYPVILDPAIESSSSSVTERFIRLSSDGQYITEDKTSSYINTSFHMQPTDLLYWKTSTLPTIPASAYVSGATLSYWGYSEISVPVITLHEVTSEWSATSEDIGEFEEDIIDYCFLDSPQYYSWNITELFNYWNNQYKENYGVVLVVNSGHAALLTKTSGTATRPSFTVSYTDMKGTEDYWSYSSHSAGNAGSGVVNVANGNLTLAIPTLSTTDNIMPYTATLVYNSALANKEYSYDNTETAFAKSYMPYGFKLNINETVIEKSYVNNDDEEELYYVYADADGTEHGFYKSSEGANIYIDEDGLQKKLKVVSSQTLTITDDSKITRTFSLMLSSLPNTVRRAWYLTKLTDQNGNSLIIDYANPCPEYFDEGTLYPTKISLQPSGTGNLIEHLRFYYNSAGMLQTIENPSSKEAYLLNYSVTPTGTVSFEERNYLRRIEHIYASESVAQEAWNNFIAYKTSIGETSDSDANYPDIITKAISEYTYSTGGYITSIKDSVSKRDLSYEWQSAKVTGIIEGATAITGVVGGQMVTFSYGTGYTVMTSTGNDDALNTSDDIITRYVYDNYGRAISIYSSSLNGSEIYGATTGKYETQESVKNNLKEQTTLGGNAVNYLLNGDFEDQLNYWTSSGGVSAYANLSFAGDGMYGAKFSPSPSAYISQRVSLKAGEYTLSFLYNTANAEGVLGTVTIASLESSGLSVAEEISISKNSTVNSSFVKSFTVPNHNYDGGDTIEITVTFNKSPLTTNTPTIIVDRIMLENNVGASAFSLVTYGSFDTSGYDGATPVEAQSFWETESASSPNIVTNVDANFGKVLKIEGSIGQVRYVKQRIFREADEYLLSANNYISTVGTDYIVSGFAYSHNAARSNNALFGIRVEITYYDPTTQTDSVVSHYFGFVPGCKGWQFTGGTFNVNYLPDGTAATGRVKAIDVCCDFSYQAYGYAYFDNVSVVEAEDNAIERRFYYNALDGKKEGLLARVETVYYAEYYEYNDNRNITRVANNRGEITDYIYDSLHKDRVIRTIEYDFTYYGGGLYPYREDNPDSLIVKTAKNETNYTYNSYGLVTETTTYSYQEDPNEINTSTRLCNSYTYNIDTQSPIFGSLITETDSLGITVRHYYNSNTGKLLATVNEEDDRGICYTYDEFGNLTSVTPATYVSSTSYSSVSGAESVEYTYNDRNLLSTIVTESTTYTFTYDAFGNATSVGAGTSTLATYTYNNYNGKLNQITYGNGFSEEYVYNDIELLKEVWYNYTNGTRTLAFEYEYTADGQVYKFVDNINEKTTVYRYDANSRLIGFSEYDNTSGYVEFSSNLCYDVYNGDLGLIEFKLNYQNGDELDFIHLRYNYVTDLSRVLQELIISSLDTNKRILYTYDNFDRIISKTLLNQSAEEGYTFNNQVAYEYKANENNTTGLVERYTSVVSGGEYTHTDVYTYTYDDRGNIVEISYNDHFIEIRYSYDDLGQLVREDNSWMQGSLVYTYDDAGNLLTKKSYNYTTSEITTELPIATFTYQYAASGWGDVLTTISLVSEWDTYTKNIAYNSAGYPMSYNGYTLTWEGNLLVKAENSRTTITYTYNDEGIRTSKTKNGITTRYYLNGSQIIGEETNGNITVYVYDESGSPIGMQYHGASYAEDEWDIYWYTKNLQGDISGVYNDEGTCYFIYRYNAWGDLYYESPECAEAWDSSATVNHIKYRGYYYDYDLGLYYLNSRYYDQYIGRFISPDNVSVLTATPDALTDKNLYVYCDNNPVMRVDPNGDFWWLIKGVAGAVVNVVTSYIAAKVTGQEYTWKDAVISTASGFVSGAFSWGIFVGATFEGAITTYDNCKNGIPMSISIVTGIISASSTALSIGNLVKLPDSLEKIAITSFVDLVFGTGFASLSTAINKVINEKHPKNAIEYAVVGEVRGVRGYI